MTPQEAKTLRADLQRARKKITHQAQEINRLSTALAQTKAALDEAMNSKLTRPGLLQRIGACLRRSGQ